LYPEGAEAKSKRAVRLPDWIYVQSAALPFRGEARELEVLLVRSRNGRRWGPPKGIVEPGMTAHASAAKEAAEEAGVVGAIADRALGSYRREKWGGACSVAVYPLRVTAELDDWPEAESRRREWLPLAGAVQKVDDEALRKLIEGLPQALKEIGTAATWIPSEACAPPRLIHLLRHAKSSWADPTLDDFVRPLAARGRRAGKIMKRYLRIADIRSAIVLCSPALRTRETLARVRESLGAEADVKFEKGLYHSESLALTDRLRQLPDEAGSVMVVGHNPSLQDLAVNLAGDGHEGTLSRMRAEFPTGVLATLVFPGERWRELAPGSCGLHSFVVPRELE
jgi:phosphohistidine phosphatase